MLITQIEVLTKVVFCILFIQEVNCVNDLATDLHLATSYAQTAFTTFIAKFDVCMMSQIYKKGFIVDNLKKFVNPQSKTTIGISPKFTSNRKFLANMLTSKEFKQMLEVDLREIRKSYILKMKYCDRIAMDQRNLRELYDRETDPSRM